MTIALDARLSLNALRGDASDFRQMAAQGVERRRALPDHELTRAMAHQRRLVLHSAHGNEAPARTPCRLAYRRRVGRPVLVAPDPRVKPPPPGEGRGRRPPAG